MLKAGNIIPTIGTSIDGKYDAVIFYFDILFMNINLHYSTPC